MTKTRCILLAALLYASVSFAQDSSLYRFRLNLPFLDLPQNQELPHALPSMGQALEFSHSLYELGFYGIESLSDRIIRPRGDSASLSRKAGNAVLKYGLSLAFSKYGSELPIPLGVWGHEEFHRSILGQNGIASKNGNWFPSRWDGTVYGVSDASLSALKRDHAQQLLYAYVAGIQYHNALNEVATLEGFYKPRSMPRAALLLYNAWYVYDYFRFSTSFLSDSVKVLAPPHESRDPMQRDFAGADLTAWAYDMFQFDEAYDQRDSFPGGEGVNRRIGYSDLSPEAKTWLQDQKKLSLLNFFNPSIFFIRKIRVGEQVAFSLFTQYAPTHFGNTVSLQLPFQYKKYDLLLNLHRYRNRQQESYGLGLGIMNIRILDKLESDLVLHFWKQPVSFFEQRLETGSAFKIRSRLDLGKGFTGSLTLLGKSKGWMQGNPYLGENLSVQLGILYGLKKN